MFSEDFKLKKKKRKEGRSSKAQPSGNHMSSDSEFKRKTAFQRGIFFFPESWFQSQDHKQEQDLKSHLESPFPEHLAGEVESTQLYLANPASHAYIKHSCMGTASPNTSAV